MDKRRAIFLSLASGFGGVCFFAGLSLLVAFDEVVNGLLGVLIGVAIVISVYYQLSRTPGGG